jgi:uncharacterized membrane protein
LDTNSQNPDSILTGIRLPAFTRKDVILAFSVMAVAIVSELPFFYAAHGHLPQAHDLTVHWMRATQFDETLRSGVWYPRWLGGMNYGYGAATTLFYAPLAYYATSAAHALLGDWSHAIQAVVLAAGAASAAAFFLYARTLVGSTASAVAALMYLLLPYRLIDLYHRAAVPELIAFVWMPLVMLAINSATKRLSARSVIGGAIAYGLLVVTHPPVAYLFSISLVVFVLARMFFEKNWHIIASASCIVTIGAALSAFYWVPAMGEVDLVKQTVTQFFTDKKGYITGLAANAGFGRLLAASALLTLVLMLLFAMPVKSAGEHDTKRSLTTPYKVGWSAVGLLAFLMMTPAAAPIERLLPGISGIAFAWRWQAIEVLAVSVLAGIATEKLMQSRSAHRRFKIVGLSSTALAVVAVGVVGSAMASNLTVSFIPPVDAIEEDFTPVDSPRVAELTKGATAAIEPAQPGASVRLIQWQPQARIIETSSSSPATLEVPTFMFPGWLALIDGEKTSLRSDPRLETIVVDLPPGDHNVTLIFANTETRRRAEQVSVAVLAICAILLVGGLVTRNPARITRSS